MAKFECQYIPKKCNNYCTYIGSEKVVPFHDALVGAYHRGLYVDGVIPHSSQLHGFIQSAHYIQSVMPLWQHRGR